jgi:hypothetical protein
VSIRGKGYNVRILANEEQNTVQLNLMEMLISKSVLRNGWSNLTSLVY